MRTLLTTFRSFAELQGDEPEPPSIGPDHRCAQCARLAYRDRETACQAADDRAIGTIIGCDRAGCGHTVLPEDPEPSPRALSPLREGTTCAATGKIRYDSESLANSADGQLKSIASRRSGRRGKKKYRPNISYPCRHCRGWHLSSDAS